MSYALGLIETKGLIAAIEATDAASKAAAVVVSAAELTDAAYMTIRIEGELGAVQAAVAAAAAAAQRVGELIAVHVIPRPDDGLRPVTPSRRYISKYHESDRRLPLNYGEGQGDGYMALEQKAAAARPFTQPKAVPPKEAATAQIRTKQAQQQTPPLQPPPQSSEVERATPSSRSQGSGSDSSPSMADLAELPVVKLRQYARTVPNLPIIGRQISMANKDQLLAAIRTALGLD